MALHPTGQAKYKLFHNSPQGFARGLLQISVCPPEHTCHQLMLLKTQGTSTAEVMEWAVEDLLSALRSTHLLLYDILEATSFKKKQKQANNNKKKSKNKTK